MENEGLKSKAEFNTPKFQNVKSTVLFMEYIHKWIAIIHDLSSTRKYISKRLPAKSHFNTPKIKD